MDGKSIIIGEIQKAVGQVVGRSSAAVMRKAGKSASYTIWPNLPDGLQPMEAGEVMKNGIASLGGFGSFSITGIDNGVAQIQFGNCFFSSFAEVGGMEVGSQPICFFGFGLVEETYKRLTGIECKVELTHYDPDHKTCHETCTPR